MPAIRKAGAYSKKYARAYTRTSKKRAKNFIKTVPQSKIPKFTSGSARKYQRGKFETIIKFTTKEPIQVRDNALEASRQSIARKLEKEIPNQYYFEVHVFPHHILRENKMLTGAGSDRMQTGMQKSFGKTIGRAAMIKPGEPIFIIATSGQKQIRLAKSLLKAVKAKIPGQSQIVIEGKVQ